MDLLQVSHSIIREHMSLFLSTVRLAFSEISGIFTSTEIGRAAKTQR